MAQKQSISASTLSKNLSFINKNSNKPILVLLIIIVLLLCSTLLFGYFYPLLFPQTKTRINTTYLDFNQVAIGMSSLEQPITVINDGQDLLEVVSIRLIGENPKDFKIVSDTCRYTKIDYGEQCEIMVSFTPSSMQRLFAELEIDSNSRNAPQKVRLSGGPQPSFFISPASVDFGGHRIDATASATEILTIVSIGDIPLVISDLSLNEGSNFSIQANDCGTEALPNGTRCTITVGFKPLTTTHVESTLTINHNGRQSPRTVPLEGEGVEARLCIDPPSAIFPPMPIDQTEALGIVLHSCGSAPVKIENVSLNIGQSDQFKIDHNCDSRPLNRGEACTVTIAFTPNIKELYTLLGLVITHSAADSPTFVPFKAEALAPVLCIEPTEGLHFGQIVLEHVENTQRTLDIRNCGNASLTINPTINSTVINNSTIARQEFTIVTNSCPLELMPDESCQLTISFRPAMEGERQATLELITNTALPNVTYLTLSGDGITARACLNPSRLDFKKQLMSANNNEPQTQMVELTSCGSATLILSQPTLSGLHANDFLLDMGDCAGVVSLPSGQTCNMWIDFIPSSSGQKEATLTVQPQDQSAGRSTINLYGEVMTPEACLSNSQLSFGSQTVKQPGAGQQITVSNCGSAPLQINVVSLTGSNPTDFILKNNCAKQTFQPNQSCTITVQFKPNTHGYRMATVMIASNANNSPHTVTLMGNGMD